MRRLLVPVNMVNCLTQMREADQELEELLGSIATKGQLYQGIAAVLTESEAREYLAGLNKAYRANHRLDDLTAIKESARSSIALYIILVAGERRYNACSLGAAKIKKREIEPTVHFDGRYYIELRFGLTVGEALEIQLTENAYNPPRAVESAISHWRLWRYNRDLDPTLTVPQFAKKVCRPAAWMHAALRFAELPECLQKLAHEDKKKGGLPYMTLVELGRFYEVAIALGKEVTEEKLKGMATFLWTKQLKPKEVREFITTCILQASGKAPELFSTMDFASDEGAAISSRTAAQKLGRAMRADFDYFNGMLELAKKGEFRQHHPLANRRMSADSATHAVARVFETAAEVAAQLDREGIARGSDIRAKAQEVLPRTAQTLLALDELPQKIVAAQ
jgi:hypothetical protein